MASSSPLWKQLFDAVDERLSPTINEMARSEDAATLAALGRRGRSEIDRRMEQASRRALHLFNLPAGSDVNRLLEHIARLEREVRDLRNLLTDRENAEYLASLAARHEAARPRQRREAPTGLDTDEGRHRWPRCQRRPICSSGFGLTSSATHSAPATA